MTTYDSDEDIFRSLSQGAKGSILKDAPRQDILTAIRAVNEERTYTSSSVAAKALVRMGKPSLTQRELDVLQLLAEGRSNKDIARRLDITEGTAKTHVKEILTKLDGRSPSGKSCDHLGLRCNNLAERFGPTRGNRKE